MPKKTTAVPALLLSLTFALPVFATEPDKAALDKRETAATELVSVSGSKQQYAQMIRVLSQSVQNGFRQNLTQALQQKSISPEQHEKTLQIIQKHASDLGSKYEEGLNEVMPWDALEKNIYVPRYSKHFPAEEISDLIAFYKSSSGKKFAATAPQLMLESSQAVSSGYSEALTGYAMKLLQEKLMQPLAELEPLQPAAKPQTDAAPLVTDSAPPRPASTPSAPKPQE